MDEIEIYPNKHLNNIVKQNHSFIKKRTKVILGLRSFYSADMTIMTIVGIENIFIIQKNQTIGYKNKATAFEDLLG